MTTKKRKKLNARARPRKGSGREPALKTKKRKQTPAQRAASLRNLEKARKALTKQRKAEKKSAKKPAKKAAPGKAKKPARQAAPKAKKRQTKEELRQELLALKKQLEALKKKPAKKAAKKAAKKRLTPEQIALEQGRKLLKAFEEKPVPSKKIVEDAYSKIRAAASKKIQELIRPRKKHDEVLGSPGYNRPWLERREDGKLNIRYAYRARGGEVLDDESIPRISDDVYSVLRDLFKLAEANGFKRYDTDVRLKVSGPAKMLYGDKYYARTDMNVKGHVVSVADIVLGFVNSGPNAMDMLIERLDTELSENAGRRLETVSITIYENK